MAIPSTGGFEQNGEAINGGFEQNGEPINGVHKGQNGEPINGVDKEENGEGINGGNKVWGEEDFDPSAPPPFRVAEIRAAIPKHCWVKDPWRSLSYVIRDVLVVFGLMALVIYFDNWTVWPLYWVAQGTMFWALFVLGHDW